MSDLIVIGGGEFARVVIEAAEEHFNILGFVDPLPCEETVLRLGVQRLGDDSAVEHYPNAKLVIGVGSVSISSVRQKIAEMFAHREFANVVDSRACVSFTAKIHPGAIILANATVCTGAEIYEHAIINIGSQIDHDVKVGQYVQVGTSMTLPLDRDL